MLKNLFLVFLFFIAAFSIKANTFQARANVYMDRTYAEVSVCNNLYVPVMCSGEAKGMTASRNFVYAYMRNAVIYPGNCGYLYIYTNNYNPFVRVEPRIFCSTGF